MRLQTHEPGRAARRPHRSGAWLDHVRRVITTTEGIWNTAIWNGIPLAILILNRNEVVEGTDLSLAVVALPGFLGLMIAASAIGPAYYLAAEREDGTVLRAKAVPHGILGYVTGVLTQASLETFLGIALILIPGFILFPGLVVDDPLRWGVFVIVVVLGLLAVLPAGVVIGSVVRSPRLVGGLGFLIIGGMAVVSGILIPLQTMPGWVQVIGQMLPTYWIGVGMRFVFLPDAAAAIEIGQTWRLLEATAVSASGPSSASSSHRPCCAGWRAGSQAPRSRPRARGRSSGCEPWWAVRDSNPRHPRCKRGALTS